jgi:hypothetical protein
MQKGTRLGMVLEGFKRSADTTLTMGTAFSTGKGDHLPPMKMENSLFLTETQADVLRNELVVELMDEESDVWENAAEDGLVKVKVPEKGKMVKVKVTGQAVVFVNAEGELVIDNRG